MKKELKVLLAKVEAQGGLVTATKGGHIQVKCPNPSQCDGSGIVVIASTTSDYRSIKNTVSGLRRCGFTL